MNSTSTFFNSALTEFPPNQFIPLKEKVFGEYKIVYHINDAYSIDSLSKFRGKHQLLFQKFKNKVQQLNLILVDSLFPNILSDVALEVFLNNISSFNQYILLKKTIIVIDPSIDKDYFRYKFYSFIHFLLYSEIASYKICNGSINNNKVFCVRNNSGEIDFFPFFEQNKLQLLLLERMKLEINLSSSSISKKEATLCLKIFVD